MPIHRVTCSECGLSATHIQSGDRGVTSFLEFSAGARCSLGGDALARGVSPIAAVAQCPKLKDAIAQALKDFADSQVAQRS
ncbi:hypothetical protein [Terricaulis sp.]|uniref:hypothetical protein n=1 Tax=Terricaulis sp. TaxID=2768686 RepID=UPI002AC65003|nr:hypothetical protein [Terricaulis sp.]MDZ4690211.1 hypothetical protein [Terricaulis sp.]